MPDEDPKFFDAHGSNGGGGGENASAFGEGTTSTRDPVGLSSAGGPGRSSRPVGSGVGSGVNEYHGGLEMRIPYPPQNHLSLMAKGDVFVYEEGIVGSFLISLIIFFVFCGHVIVMSAFLVDCLRHVV